ncbi:cyclopropane-fatty-acyl-phospholipid synthase [Variovorax paradoxus]|jgi:cyclopropane-fatty-acyl-phospholipid synthase|uniref:SAM-dependent methyltransferase n=1 Tax=Variovorax paradoxus TaxID=34073 RepID=UPI00277DEC61|nr:cyclopropane-fatty-acyl-phospholipid synthase family protein [Variovorax paradoxus]MDP9931333.1 cyclopropane-fatty-acyl-phospholipid synthase [Variovorax paradoxus]MDQ0025895.1 cyclopropane-fatty-acyl-phospholipid synthase [Variovorax paradoxus]
MQSLIPKIESQLASLPVPIALELPDGRRVAKPGSRVTLAFSDWSALAKLAARQVGAIGEAYVEGKVQIEGAMRDLIDATVGMLPGNPAETDTAWWTRLMRLAKSRGSHSLNKDAEQIQFHYDVSDDFYALWLDPRRVYSCAYFRTPELSLAEAQEAKLDHICRKLMLQPGERFLDIGSGWGGLLLWAAEHYGVDATGITLSKNQHAHVQRLIEEKGLQGRVRVELRDYRELSADAPFDKISSVGMFEHVGSAYMPTYFRKIHSLLKPGGLVLNHGITSGQLDYRQLGAGMGDFIEKYIFPGGELLHVTHVLRETAAAGLEMVDTESLRPHYARTLWAWSDSLEAQLGKAREVLESAGGRQGENAERILRAYRLYLAGSAMSFEQGWISLHQMLSTRPDGRVEHGVLRGSQSVYPFARDYIYK